MTPVTKLEQKLNRRSHTMSATDPRGKRPLSEKLSRLATRLRDPEWRRYGGLLLGGKAMGIGLVLLIITVVSGLFFGHVYAQTAAPEIKAADVINPVNTAWVLIAAFLVFGMQVGFTMLEAGFCRSRETVNVLMECVVDTCLCGILFYAIGFAFMFSHGNGFIGYHWFFLQGVPATYETTGVAFLAVWLFQFAFADTCSTITSGAMIGRTGFVGDLLYSLAVSGFIYPIIGHWAWGPDGWLALRGSDGHMFPSLGMGFHDFAGSTVVHTIGGFIALAGAIVLGPRLGRTFKRDRGAPMLPHDLTIAVSGGLLLWFGWDGFNPGSTLSAMDSEGSGRVATNTTLAACPAGLTAMIYAYVPSKKWDVSFTINGFLAGLVAITCPCYWVSPTGAILLGGVAGGLVVAGVELLEWLRIDDPIGAVPVHGFCGIWGTLSLGLFAAGKYGIPTATGADTTTVVKGLFYGGGLDQLKAQFIGSAVCVICVFGFSLLLMYFLKNRGVLRLSRDAELEGMDLAEHGTAAYHMEFGQGMTYSTPAGLPFNGSHKEPPEEEPVAAAKAEE